MVSRRLSGVCRQLKHPQLKNVMKGLNHHYLAKDDHRLVQLIACNLLPHGYWFHVSGVIPEGKDPELADAKLILRYSCHTPKDRARRRRRGGMATVRYLRSGRFFILLATHGKGEFFQREEFRDARENSIIVGGYSLSVNRETKKVLVKLHRDTVKRYQRLILERVGWSRKSWESLFWRLPFLPFKGVRDDVFRLLNYLNRCRKQLRLQPVDWRRCVRKKIKPVPALIPSSPEMVELLRAYPPG